MTSIDVGSVIQREVLLVHGADPGVELRALQGTVRDLRRRRRDLLPLPPDEPVMVAASLLTELPLASVLGARALAAAGPHLLGLSATRPRVVVLDGGTGAPVLGLAAFLARAVPDVQHLELDLVDAVPAWSRVREPILDRCAAALWDGTVDHRSHVAVPEDPGGVLPLLRAADLVLLADTANTEAQEGPAGWLEVVLEQASPDTRVVLLDLSMHTRNAPSAAVPALRHDVSVLLDVDVHLPAPAPVGEVTEHLLTGQGWLRPVQRLAGSITVLGRPGLLRAAAPAQVRYTSDQRRALDRFDRFLASDGRIFVLHGAAGTGKSTLFPELMARAAVHDLPACLLAPTGRAARRLQEVAGQAGTTIHSSVYAYQGQEYDAEDDTFEQLPTALFGPGEPDPGPALYLVDESSLIGDEPDEDDDAEVEVRFHEGRLLTDLLSHALHHSASRIVFVGDPAQLPPVKEDLSPALDAPGLEARTGTTVTVAELTEVVRQDDRSAITVLAQALRVPPGGQPGPVPTYDADPDRGLGVVSRTEAPAWLLQACLDGQAAVVTARNADLRAWNMLVRDHAGRPRNRPVAEDRLQIVRTDHTRDLPNGEEVTVLEVADDPVEVENAHGRVLLRPARILSEQAGVGPIPMQVHLVEDLLWGVPQREHPRVTKVLLLDLILRTGKRPGDPEFDDLARHDARFTALRTTYAYARTCHRAQGSEWEHVVIDAAGARNLGAHTNRWLYTAVTRARRAVWATSWPGPPPTFDETALIDGVRDALIGTGLRLERTVPLQHGVKLHISDGAAQLVVDLYRRAGLPSSVQRVGPTAPPFTETALAVIEDWIVTARAAARPVAPEMEALAARLTARLAAQGEDLRCAAHGSYQVRFELARDRRRAAVVHHHRADGTLGPVASRDGDADLLAVLEQALEEEGSP